MSALSGEPRPLSLEPTWAEVESAFRRHIGHYAKHGGGEIALIGSRAEGAVSLQYAGRVVYELLQNALDRAQGLVVVRFDGKTLVVGNDGSPVSVDPDYDYSSPKEGQGRSDFNALCSLHTSNKSPERQLGNKGIGFRSVFGVSRRVQVWSRLANGGWWGLELAHRLVPSRWEDSAIPGLDEIVRRLGDQPRPSFQFPRPLHRERDPVPDCEGLRTVVVVPIEQIVDPHHDDDNHKAQITKEIEHLQTTRFQFVGLRRKGVTLRLNGDEIRTSDGWPFFHSEHPELASHARKAEHPVPCPTTAVAWPPVEDGNDGAGTEGLIYNYLPTRMSTGLPVDVHGDFQLKADREGMTLDPDNPVGGFNDKLLLKAAEGHVSALREELNKERPRSDFWRLAARPGAAASGEWVAALRDLLFPDFALTEWVDMAAAFFVRRPEPAAAVDFWEANSKWLGDLTGFGPSRKNWRNKAKELCDALAEKEIPLIPVVVRGGERLVPLPSRQPSGARAARRVFYFGSEEEGNFPPVPEALLRSGRAVTTADLGYLRDPAGIQTFNAKELLPELRQVPNNPKDQDLGRHLSAEDQGALLSFACRLLKPRMWSSSHFAWRAFSSSEEDARVGRALATVYLLTVEGSWEPARQLSVDRVDGVWLGDYIAKEDQPRFLEVLGVAPTGAVPLLEDGDEGVLPVRPLPPAPQEAGTARIPPLEPRFEPLPSLQGMVATLSGLGADEEGRSVVFEKVRTTPWLNAELFRRPEHVPPLPELVAPLDVVLRANDPQAATFFAVASDGAIEEDLRRVGALEQPESLEALRIPKFLSSLRQRCPDPAALPASVALSLATLFNRLANKLGEESGEGVPVLVERDRTYAWLDKGEEAWLALREDRQELRRFFPDLALVATAHRKDLAARLGVKQVRLRRQVHPALPEDEQSPTAQEVFDRIHQHRAVFAAVAEQSRQVDRILAPDQIHRAWSPRAIVQVEDTWLELSVEGPQRKPVSWRKEEYDDVFYLQGDDQEAPGRILFDCRQQGKAPPLRHFGDALAVLLVNNVALGPQFAQALAAIDEGSIDDYIERHHLEALVEEWERQLEPLKDEQRAVLVEALARVCHEPERVFANRRLGLSDLRPGGPWVTEEDLREELERGLPRELRIHLPDVAIASEHDRKWNEWLRGHCNLLDACLKGIEGEHGDWGDELSGRARKGFDRIDFSPSRVVGAWLREKGVEIADEDVESWLRAIPMAFEPVTSPPVAPAALGWRAGPGHGGAPAASPDGKLTLRDLINDAIAKGAVGDGAELALLQWVVAATKPLLDRPEARETLLGVFAPGSKTREAVEAELKADRLEDALHISRYWSGAGFDLLGLEETEGTIVPARYECKALPEAEAARVFLTRNELAVGRQVQREGPGTWRLVGVERTGRCVDLTPLIEELLTKKEVVLEPLYRRGLEPDGLRLVVVKPGGRSAPG